MTEDAFAAADALEVESEYSYTRFADAVSQCHHDAVAHAAAVTRMRVADDDSRKLSVAIRQMQHAFEGNVAAFEPYVLLIVRHVYCARVFGEFILGDAMAFGKQCC